MSGSIVRRFRKHDETGRNAAMRNVIKRSIQAIAILLAIGVACQIYVSRRTPDYNDSGYRRD